MQVAWPGCQQTTNISENPQKKAVTLVIRRIPIIGINLQDGTSITLNELSRPRLHINLSLCKDYIVLRKIGRIEQLSQKAFAEAYEQGELLNSAVRQTLL